MEDINKSHFIEKITSETKIFICFSIITGLGMAGDAMIYCILPVAPESFKVTVFQIGILLSVNRFVRILTNELSNFIVARARSYKPMVFAVCLSAFITLGYAVPLGFWWLLFLRIIWGGCFSILRIEGYIATLKASTQKNIGRFMGWFVTIKAIIYCTMTLTSGLLADILSPLTVPVIFSIFTLSCLLLIRNPVKMWGSGNSSGMSDKRPARHYQKVSNGKVLLLVGMITLVTAIFSTMITSLRGRIIVDTILPGSGLVVGAATFSGLFATISPFIHLLAPFFGHLGDKYGRRKALMVVLGIQALAIIILALVKLWIVVFGILVLDMFVGTASNIFRTSFAGENAKPEEQTVFMNRFSTFQDMGSAFGPFLGYAVYSISNNFMGIAIMMLPMFALSLYSLHRFKNQEKKDV